VQVREVIYFARNTVIFPIRGFGNLVTPSYTNSHLLHHDLSKYER